MIVRNGGIPGPLACLGLDGAKYQDQISLESVGTSQMHVSVKPTHGFARPFAIEGEIE
jgi:hypothetical protein